MSATTSRDRAALNARFDELRRSSRRALVAYVTAGHPDRERSLALLREIESAGADIIEVGVPFSDPMADGPIIQKSSQEALAAGMNLERTLELIAEAELTVPVVVFSYLNPILAAGPRFLERASGCGASGLLITDLPVGADPTLEARLASGPLALIRLVAPTTPTDRMGAIAESGDGFVYLISRLGVTGARADLSSDLGATVQRLRSATSLPICVGFGVSTPEQARTVAKMADGVVVGSAIVRAASESVAAAGALVRGLRKGIDS